MRRNSVLRSDAKWDARLVWFSTISRRDPVFHNDPLTDGSELPNHNDGFQVPLELRTACGQLAYRRLEVPSLQRGRRVGRLVDQGVLVPLGHAVKFGRPCATCKSKSAFPIDAVLDRTIEAQGGHA